MTLNRDFTALPTAAAGHEGGPRRRAPSLPFTSRIRQPIVPTGHGERKGCRSLAFDFTQPALSKVFPPRFRHPFFALFWFPGGYRVRIPAQRSRRQETATEPHGYTLEEDWTGNGERIQGRLRVKRHSHRSFAVAVDGFGILDFESRACRGRR